MSDGLHTLTLAELARRIESRQLSPVELVGALLARIESLEGQVNAFITRTAEFALARARHAEAEISAGGYRGPMHGMPFALKDIFETAGVLTSGHSRVCIDHVPARDGFAVARLNAAGAVLLGKLATHEFAHGGPSFDLPWPPARNPWNLEHITGGSSSGPGAAVAAGFVPGVLGSDTGGSIRTPSALCGLAGLKPTYGLVSRSGVLPNSWSFDHCGPMAWTVEDCAILLQVIAGHDAADTASADRSIPDYRAALRGGDLRGIRVGVPRHLWEEDVDTPAELVRATEASLDVLRSLGATVEDVRMHPAQVYHDVKTVISLSELFSIYRDPLVARPGDFGEDFLGRGGLAGALFQASDYMLAQRVRRGLLEAAVPLYERFDVLVTPGAGPAPRLDAHRTVSFWEKPSLFSPFSVFGNPALIVCCGFAGNGLPMGLQIGGRPFDECTVLRVGHAYEQATDWRARRPALVPGSARPPVRLAAPAPLDDRVATAAVRAATGALASQAGLVLDDRQFDLLLRAAPHAFAMIRRIREPLARAAEPANTFRFDRCTLPVN
ncbi:MAG: amidase [bacterium]